MIMRPVSLSPLAPLAADRAWPWKAQPARPVRSTRDRLCQYAALTSTVSFYLIRDCTHSSVPLARPETVRGTAEAGTVAGSQRPRTYTYRPEALTAPQAHRRTVTNPRSARLHLKRAMLGCRGECPLLGFPLYLK